MSHFINTIFRLIGLILKNIQGHTVVKESKLICVGALAGAFGVRGEVRLKSFTSNPDDIENYAPFPAIAITPQRGATITGTSSTVTLEWSTSDVDDDIVSYEILFDTVNEPTTSLGSTTNTTINASISTGNTYYWRVITKDSFDNTSNSELFEFRVE